MQNIVYRDLKPSEFDQMAALGGRLFTESFGHLYSAEDLTAFLEQVHSRQGVEADFQSGRRYWIAENLDTNERSRWIGYCKGGPVGLPVESGDGKALELKQIYVDRQFHGLGVGRALMNHFLGWAESEGAQSVFLSCWSQNERALAFYKAYGFEIVGSCKFQIGNHLDDDWILRRKMA